MSVKQVKLFDLPLDYSLPNLYYFSDELLKELQKQLIKLIPILNKAGFQECHFPFLVPRGILLNYKDLVRLDDYIKVYSGKDRRSYAYLRPDGIFSQGTILARKIIKSYKDLPLKLFETSPGYIKNIDKNKWNIFTSSEQSFSIQCGVFTVDNSAEKYCRTLLSTIFNKLAIKYTVKKNNFIKAKSTQYITKINGNEIILAKFYNFNQEISKKLNIYFSDKKGRSAYPYMCTFSLSQNIFLLNNLKLKK